MSKCFASHSMSTSTSAYKIHERKLKKNKYFHLISVYTCCTFESAFCNSKCNTLMPSSWKTCRARAKPPTWLFSVNIIDVRSFEIIVVELGWPMDDAFSLLFNWCTRRKCFLMNFSLLRFYSSYNYLYIPVGRAFYAMDCLLWRPIPVRHCDITTDPRVLCQIHSLLIYLCADEYIKRETICNLFRFVILFARKINAAMYR